MASTSSTSRNKNRKTNKEQQKEEEREEQIEELKSVNENLEEKSKLYTNSNALRADIKSVAIDHLLDTIGVETKSEREYNKLIDKAAELLDTYEFDRENLIANAFRGENAFPQLALGVILLEIVSSDYDDEFVPRSQYRADDKNEDPAAVLLEYVHPKEYAKKFGRDEAEDLFLNFLETVGDLRTPEALRGVRLILNSEIGEFLARGKMTDRKEDVLGQIKERLLKLILKEPEAGRAAEREKEKKEKGKAKNILLHLVELFPEEDKVSLTDILKLLPKTSAEIVRETSADNYGRGIVFPLRKSGNTVRTTAKQRNTALRRSRNRNYS